MGIRRLVVPVLGVALAGAVLAGCTATSGTTAVPHPSAAAPAPRPVAQAATVAFYPSAGAHGVNPADVITAAVRHGTINHIALTNAAGKSVAGKLSPDDSTWTVAEPLGYGKPSTWPAPAPGEDGTSTKISGRFSTLAPDHQISGHLNVSDGQTYGIAMPIALTFDSPVTDKPAVERALSVTTSKPTTGWCAWLAARTVHWRPSSYYAPGTHVTVAATLYGVAFAPGVYGRDDV